MFRTTAVIAAVATTSVLAANIVAQQHGEHDTSMKMSASSATTAKKIREAASAAPPEISGKAAVMDWPDTDGMPMKQLRAGTNGWMCMPSTGLPGTKTAAADPMCVDKSFGALLDAWATRSDPHVTTVGIGYMLQGDKGASNTDPFAVAPTPTNQWTVSPAHIMLVLPNGAQLDAFPSDPHTGGPWVMWKGTKYAHLMVPVAAMPKTMMSTK